MATPTSDEIAKLIGEIHDLKNTLDETIVDRAVIDGRYADALSGLVGPTGEFDPNAWANLSPEQQITKAVELARLKQMLENAVSAAEPIVCIPRTSLMYKKEASNGAIVFLTILALVGLGVNLWEISCNWTKATTGLTKEQVSSAPLPTPTPASPDAAPANSKTETAKSLKPTEGDVLYMVILLGTLGGFLRLASSLANYVGNRQLLKSWIIYYLLTPIQGAALAPLVYLLLRVGVLNPANTPSGSTSPADSLNLIGIYAFAALTGLFSKQAIEMLADVFSTIFKKAETKDALVKSKVDANKAADKPIAK